MVHVGRATHAVPLLILMEKGAMKQVTIPWVQNIVNKKISHFQSSPGGLSKVSGC